MHVYSTYVLHISCIIYEKHVSLMAYVISLSDVICSDMIMNMIFTYGRFLQEPILFPNHRSVVKYLYFFSLLLTYQDHHRFPHRKDLVSIFDQTAISNDEIILQILQNILIPLLSLNNISIDILMLFIFYKMCQKQDCILINNK